MITGTGSIIQERLKELAPDSAEQVTPTNVCEGIELTEEELAEAIQRGKEQKYFRLRREEYKAKISTVVDWSRPNARQLYENLRETRSQTGERFKITDWNKQTVHALCLYFAGDPKFEEYGEGFKLNKGIFLNGNPGAGKTHLMAFFAKNPLQSYINITCKLVAERYRLGWTRDGLDSLEYYAQPAKAEFEHVYGQEVLGYCFGDLGTEDAKKHFGNEVNVMEHLIFQRYENHLPFNQTHFTSNLKPSEIETAYGIRARDRVREMCNVLSLEGPSWR